MVTRMARQFVRTDISVACKRANSMRQRHIRIVCDYSFILGRFEGWRFRRFQLA